MTGKGSAFVMTRAIGDAMKGQPTALLITKMDNERFVRSFNWREGNQRFIYRALTETERTQLGSASELVVPVLMPRGYALIVEPHQGAGPRGPVLLLATAPSGLRRASLPT